MNEEYLIRHSFSLIHNYSVRHMFGYIIARIFKKNARMKIEVAMDLSVKTGEETTTEILSQKTKSYLIFEK